MSTQAFETIGNPSGCELPVLAHIPHAGTFIPPDVRAGILLDDESLDAEVRRVSDLHADRLYSHALGVGGVAVINRLSRLVIDPERFRDDADEPLAANGAGPVYTRTTSGEVLRDISSDEREALLKRFYDPYSAHVASLCEQLLERFGRVLIVDCHSFGTRPVAWAASQDEDRPQVCIGTDDQHTPDELARSLIDACSSDGYTAFRDMPYKGAYVPIAFHLKDLRVRSVLIEIRRDLYMDESSGELNSGFTATQGLAAKLVDVCAAQVRPS